MQNYLSGSLSREEKRKVEMHLADCEMCSDELDGLSLLENPAKLSLIVDELNEKIDKKTQNSTKVLFLQRIKPYYSIAALLLVLVSITIFLYFNNANSDKMEMADNMAKEEIELSEEPVIEEELLAEDKSISADTIISRLKRSEEKLTDNYRVKRKSSAKRELKEEAEIKDIYEEKMEDYLAEDTTSLITSGDTDFVVSPTDSNGNSVSSDTKTVLEEVEIEEETERNYVAQDADFNTISSYKNEKSKKTKASRTKGTTIQKSNLELAKEAFAEKKYYETLLLLENAEIKPETEQYFETLWLKSLCYIELENFEKAKELLNTLSEKENNFQRKAKRKLRSIQ